MLGEIALGFLITTAACSAYVLQDGFVHLLPALKLSASELAKLPDSVLVEVRDADQHVLISKSGDGLSVEEESPQEHVKVWVPLRAIYDTADVLESRAGPH
jgi:hypothetical protein